MACLALSDIIEPTSFGDYLFNDNPEKTAFYESGIVVRSPLFDEFANAGRINHLPFWNDIDPTSAPNLSSSDSGSSATPIKIDAGEQVARTAYLNQAICESDLAVEIAADDPAQAVGTRLANYWRRQWQRRLIASLNGVLADNIANDSGDMVEDQSAATFSRDFFINALETLGDAFGMVSGMCVHSAVYFKMLRNNDIDFIEDSEQRTRLPTFGGIRLIVDDSMPVATGVYTTAIFGPGAVGWGMGSPKTPVELERDALAGDGGGIETLVTRQTHLIHPFGFKFLSASITDESPSIAELEAATEWDRVVERKNIPLAFLKTLAT